MRFPSPLLPARLIERRKRFLADVAIAGVPQTVHCPNPGGMLGLWTPGGLGLLSESGNPKRKLAMTLELVAAGEALVLINTLRPNAIVAEALAAHAIPELAGYDQVTREVRVGSAGSRLDFRLAKEHCQHFVEVKGVTLAQGRAGYFPDSVTARGARHLRELAALVGPGTRATLLFLVCRPDLDRVRPADAIDPTYGAELRRAAAAGVELLAYGCAVSREEVTLRGLALPVELDSPEPGPHR